MAVLNGLSDGLLLFLIAGGLTIIFGVLNVINFAHGSFFMVGAYVTFFLAGENAILPAIPGQFWIAVLLSGIIVGLLGGLIERFLIRPIYDIDHIYQLLLTFGVLLLIDNGARIYWGTQFKSVNTPPGLDSHMSILGGAIPRYNLFLIVAGSVLGIIMWYIFRRTKFGKTTIAAAENQDIADAVGINVPLVYTAVFIAGSALAGIGGALAAPYVSIHPTMGENFVIEAFIVVIIGGVGSMSGAFIGALLLGVGGALAFIFAPALQQFIPFILLVVVLLARPEGIIGEAKA
ncbi:branched-chain amino acid ABC transporter permease [Natrinema halophilum]|uniref:branched-chain amino acid ABC transporter permease n=1 Tax=Natrinema halophilum TaxID=1699371 RepID=UPI001F1E8DD5|nr:branched-chain amino acid ABC transporter permease [Natrinema halophilum]UHQ96286.1 branched-chain amino acid ABC transporter permease [Natrinema halophilum]